MTMYLLRTGLPACSSECSTKLIEQTRRNCWPALLSASAGGRDCRSSGDSSSPEQLETTRACHYRPLYGESTTSPDRGVLHGSSCREVGKDKQDRDHKKSVTVGLVLSAPIHP